MGDTLAVAEIDGEAVEDDEIEEEVEGEAVTDANTDALLDMLGVTDSDADTDGSTDVVPVMDIVNEVENVDVWEADIEVEALADTDTD